MRSLRERGAVLTLAAATSSWSLPAAAHSFGRLYNLPVPFWMYAYGAAAALLLSFVVVGYFGTAPVAASDGRTRDLSRAAWLQSMRRLRAPALLRGMVLLLFALCLLTGFFGTRDPYRNFNMTFFWVVFVLGFAYLAALLGDFYALINPWLTLARLIGRWWRSYLAGRIAYPARLAYWPALVLYMAFIWVELFSFTRPLSLAQWLSGYTVLNLGGVWLFGARDWFRHCEFFGVFLRLLACMAPVEYVPGERLQLRMPLHGLLQHRAGSWSLLLFVLFMLSSTAFDGLRATVPWFRLFWGDPTGLLTEWLGQSPIQAYVRLRPYYLVYESLCLLLSPFLYLAVYLLFIALAKWVARSALGVRELALAFAFSLLPIALVYNVTHYFTLVLTQGVKIVSLLSDPFGRGWNLFGTADLLRAPILPDLGTVWHTQVGLILAGHIASVWIAHLEALRLFPTRRQALLSQLPMLVLMVAFTTAGLWILAQPIQQGR